MYQLFVAALVTSLVSADIGIEYNKKFGFSSEGSQINPHIKFGSNHGYSSGLSNGFETNFHGNLRDYPHFTGQNTFYPPPIPPPLPPSVYFIPTSTPNPVAYHQHNSGGQYFASGESSNILDSHRVVSIPRTQFDGATYQHQQAYHAGHHHQTTNGHQSDLNTKYQIQYNQAQRSPQIFKHFYLHVAPEDPEPPKRQQIITLPPPQKHYKIIFIKAPTVAVPPPQIIPVPQQNEEKTIVYVLLKKPEEGQLVDLPKIEAKPPSKPEVFFIKYNNKDAGQALINNIVNDYSKVETVTFAGPEQTGQYLGTQTGASKQKYANDEQYVQSDGSNYVAVDTNKYATNSDNKNDESLTTTNHASSSSIKYTGSIGYTGAFGLANKFGEESSSTSQSSSSTGSIGYTGVDLSNKFVGDASSDSQTSSGQMSKDTSTSSQLSVNKSSGEQNTNTVSPIIASLSTSETQESPTTNIADGQIANTFSLTQHVPHETYGPPKFRSS